METASVCVVGLWHLGCVVSACLAEADYAVRGVDPDPERVAKLNLGKAPLFEPGLDDLLDKHVRSGRLTFSTDLEGAAAQSSVIWLASDTPVDDQDRADLRELEKTISRLRRGLQNGALIVVSSQVPVGTCERFRLALRRKNPGLDFDIVYTPENLRLGNALECFMNPQRIVVGASEETAFEKFDELTKFLSCERLRMSLRSAEMAKHALNAFLATSVSFANEIADLCDGSGADVSDVMAALKTDERIGARAFLSPGLGFAGGTLARDLKALESLARETKTSTAVLKGALATNARRKRVVIEKLRQEYPRLRGRTVGILGLTYKPGTSTLRRSSALEVAKSLARAGVLVKAFDPRADESELLREKARHIMMCRDGRSVARGSDALILMTDWPEFRDLDFKALAGSMRRAVFIDAKNFLDPSLLREAGFRYIGMGRAPAKRERVRHDAARR